jgi:hypothetical protein
VGGGGQTDVEQVEARDAWIFRRSLGHVRMANLIVYAKIAVPGMSLPRRDWCTGELEAFRLRAAGSQLFACAV